MIKLLVVDDHDLVRMGIVRMLADVDGMTVVGEASTGEEALKLTRELMPDVVLMDVKMPGMGGIEATRKLLNINEHIRVVAVTACDNNTFPDRLLQAGAMGYVTKGSDLSEMIKAIQAVSAGNLYLSTEVAHQLALKKFVGIDDGTPFDVLSERELQTALMICNGKKPMDIAEIFCVSPKTINSYRYRIFEKLNVNTDVELTLLAVKHKMLDLDLEAVV